MPLQQASGYVNALSAVWILLAALTAIFLHPYLAALLLLTVALRSLRFYPRRVLDIGWSDLVSALRYVVFPGLISREALEESIERQWSSSGQGLVTLSVRTGFDLVLRSLDLPKGSEVLFVPGITIPWMVDIVEGNGLVATAADLSSTHSFLPEDVQDLFKANPRIVVITHLFGSILHADEIIIEAQKRGIFVVDDCAQAFVGSVFPSGRAVAAQGNLVWETAGFRGHAEADAAFVSFGTIKTLTALGGCCGHIRDARLLARMKEIQAAYPVRSSKQFFRLVLVVMLLKLSDFPAFFGLCAALSSLVRVDFDKFLVAITRGFPNRRLEQIRQRASTPLLQLLHRRLLSQGRATFNSSGTGHTGGACSLADRREAGQKLAKQLSEGGVEVAGLDEDNTWWLLPIIVENPVDMVNELWKRGYDATCSSTQLKCVSKDTGSACSRMMTKIVYLPLLGSVVGRRIDGLAEAVLSIHKSRQGSAGAHSAQKKRGPGLPWILLVVIASILVWPERVMSLLPSSSRLLVFAAAFWVAVALPMLLLRRLAVAPKLQPSPKLLAALQPASWAQGADFCKTLSFAGQIDGAVILTGGTGFVGGGILFMLLASASELRITRIVLIVRAKAGASPDERLRELRSKPEFAEVQEAFDRLVCVLEGDVAKENLGWSDERLREPWPFQEPLRSVVHCAGDVRFDRELQQAALSWISASLQTAQLAQRWGASHFAFISTAFVHAEPSSGAALEEKLVELRDFDPLELYHDAVRHGHWAEKVMNELGFPNTYTFTKAITEHLVIRSCAALGIDVSIIRPSIVGPAYAAPYAGWAGDRPSTITAAAALYAGRAVRVFRCSKHPFPMVPVDMVARVVLETLAEDRKQQLPRGKGRARVRHAAVDATEADKMPSVLSITEGLFQTLALRGDMSVMEAGLLMRLLHMASKGALSLHWFLHCAFNVVPTYALCIAAYLGYQWSCLFSGYASRSNWKTRLKTAARLKKYVSLPLQYLPFSSPSSTWFFKSSMQLPEGFDSMQYTALIWKAAIEAASRQERGTEAESVEPFQNLRLLGKNSLMHDALVSLGTSTSSLPVCVAVFIVRRVLHWAGITVSVDLASLSTTMRTSTPLVLCPTHRSLLDFVILGLICFQLEPLLPALTVPHVAADAEFSGLPLLHRVLVFLGAFFVRRGGGKVQPDPALRAELARVFRKGGVLEVFLEGLRSRGRRQLRLRTGLLRALRDVAQCTVTLVPVAISYELLPEDATFYDEIQGKPRPPLQVLALLRWVAQGFCGELPPCGNVHVCLGTTQVLNATADLPAILSQVQKELVNQTTITVTHARALAEVAKLPAEQAILSLRQGGVDVRPSLLSADMSLSQAQQWALSLQAATLLRHGLPQQWAMWLVEPVIEISEHDAAGGGLAGDAAAGKGAKALHLDKILGALKVQMSAAEDAARKAAQALTEDGVKGVSEEHLLQQLLNSQPGLPIVLARGAAHIVAGLQPAAARAAKANVDEGPAPIQPVWVPSPTTHAKPASQEEALWRWGYKDTKFVAQWADGKPAVQMTSSRYPIGTQPLFQLWSFWESELGVALRVDGARPCQLPEVPAVDATLQKQLQSTLESKVFTDAEARLRSGTGHGLADIWRLRTGQAIRVPDAVVRPATETEVHRVLELGAEKGFAVVPVGGRTNVTSATNCPESSVDSRPFVALDMRGMSRVLWVNKEDGLACVEAGITGSALKEALAKDGMTLGHEPDSMEFSTLGGWIATRASGMKRSRYGNIEDMIVEVRMATPAGIAWQHNGLSSEGGQARSAFGRTSTNTSLPSLVLGSEGCLGVVTSAVIRLQPLPEVVEYQSILFSEWPTGVAFMRGVGNLAAALRPASCRLMDNKQLRMAQAIKGGKAHGDWRSVLKMAYLQASGINMDTAVAATLVFEGSRDEVRLQRQSVTKLARQAGGLWAGAQSGEAGYALTFAIAYLRDFGLDHSILSESFETMAPWSCVHRVWPEVVAAVEREHAAFRLPGRPALSCRMTQLYSEGAVLYMYLAIAVGSLAPDAALKVFTHLEHTARQAVLVAGGSLSHHHGVGQLRASFMPEMQSDIAATGMQGLKAAWDPQNVLGLRNGVWAQTAGQQPEGAKDSAQ